MRPARPVVERLDVRACRIPTDGIESDGTLSWNATTIVVVEARSEGLTGVGYTYADNATRQAVVEHLRPLVVGRQASDVAGAWLAMRSAARSVGQVGIAAMAISAVDSALWDLHARLLGLPLVDLLGGGRASVAVYGSGGFTSYSDARLEEQLGGWASAGYRMVKMKVGREPKRDAARVALARRAIGPDVELFVDANGAYRIGDAVRLGRVFADRFDVRWFEEPRSSDDLAGLALVRRCTPAGLEVAAGEYCYTARESLAMIEAGAVDCLQADVTRCGGITGFLGVARLCEAARIDLSAHCAPAAHAHVACAAASLRHVEAFHDHSRIESMLFDGYPEVRGGFLLPDRTRPGNGLEFLPAEADRHAA